MNANYGDFRIMFTRSILHAALLLMTSLAATGAEDAAPAKGLKIDPAVQKLDAVMSRMAAFLKTQPAFQVEASSQWRLEGEQPRAGGSTYRLIVQHPQACRLEVRSTDGGKASLVCASDGKTLTRLYTDGRLAVFSRQDGGLEQLINDAMTESSLKGSGLDLIARPDIDSHVMAAVSEVKYAGEEDLNGRKAHHFSAAWAGGSVVDFWIAADPQPVLLRAKRAQQISNDGGPTRKLEVENNLAWKLDADFSKEQWALEIPAGASEAADVQLYLLKGGTDQLVGQPAPTVALKNLDGTNWDLAKHRGQQVVVIFFWTTWATPSTQDKPDLAAFLKQYENRGVVFYAVDIGETPEKVRAFVEREKYTHPVVLDPQQDGAAAYRVTSVPAAVLIGKDGTLQAVHVGMSPEARELIRQDLEQLVAGKTLVETKK